MSPRTRHAFATCAGIDWRSRPDLDELPDDAFLDVIRAAWTPERRATVGEASRAAWRAAHPDRAAIRDAILDGSPESPCDRCGADAARLFVTDYATAAHVWRCAPCAIAARAKYRQAAEADHAPEATP
jgi:Arc/MetJ family transcription regulator